MKKVLIITYYWPPAGGPGVQRVLKFAKYFPEFGWKPIILTVQNGEYPAYDESLFEDIPPECKVYRTPSIEPFSVYKKFTGMKKDEAIPVATLTEKRIGWKKKIAHWIRLNLFIPDAKIGWIPFAIKAGKHIIENEKPDVVFSSSPPPTVHLIAKALARWSKIKWVADFRDPWTGIHYYEKQKRSKLTTDIDKKLEKSVLENARKITTISSGYITHDFKKQCCEEKYSVIYNGYDENDFSTISTEFNSDLFEICHLGSIGIERNPKTFLSAVKKLIEDKSIAAQSIRFLLIGKIDRIIQKEIQALELADIIQYINYLHHKQALEKTSSANALLLLITNSPNNNIIVPGKTFEYLRLNKPIIALGPSKSEVSDILERYTHSGVIEYNDTDTISKRLLSLYNDWKERSSAEKKLHPSIDIFSRKKQSHQLADIFNTLVK